MCIWVGVGSWRGERVGCGGGVGWLEVSIWLPIVTSQRAAIIEL